MQSLREIKQSIMNSAKNSIVEIWRRKIEIFHEDQVRELREMWTDFKKIWSNKW